MDERPAQALNQSFDAIVVGSGPAGATVARELTRRGLKVLILERGGKAPVTGSMTQTLRELWMPARSLFVTNRLLAVLRGVTVGGSSIYFFGTAWEPPYDLFVKHGIDLRPQVAEAKRELSVGPVPPELMGPSARRVMDSATELGYDWKPIPKYFDQARLGGAPMGSYGVPTYEAKWNARMFVEEAVSLGATLVTSATARRVLIEDGVARGVEFVHRGRPRTAFGSRVVVAAGGIGSPVLLRASGIADAGRSLFCDPVVVVIGSLPGAGHGQELPMTAGVLLEDEGYTLTDVSVPRWLYSLITAEVGRLDKLGSYRRAAAILVETRDELNGEITRRGGIRKPLTHGDRQRLARGTQRARKILTNAGAERLCRSWLFAVQPGGTVPIGRLLDADLRSEVEGLYVCDASVIPDPWGLPPSLTLIGLGKRLAGHLVGRSSSGFAGAGEQGVIRVTEAVGPRGASVSGRERGRHLGPDRPSRHLPVPVSPHAVAYPRPSMKSSPRTDDRIALPDGRWLAYAEFGDPDGRPVMFLHGTPGYRRNPWATDAQLRAAGVRLIAPDRPGVGASTPQPGRRLLDWPDDLAHLADALGLERFAVVGFSNGGPHAAACAYTLGPRISGTALVAPLPPLDRPGALRQLGAPRWYYPLAQRAPWALRALYAGLAALARRNPRRAERLLVGGMSQADQRLFARPELAGRFGADLAGAGGRGVVDDERLMPLPWGFAPGQVKGPVGLWLGEHDQLVPPRVWLQRPGGFPACKTTVVPGTGHFLIAEHMPTILDNLDPPAPGESR